MELVHISTQLSWLSQSGALTQRPSLSTSPGCIQGLACHGEWTLGLAGRRIRLDTLAEPQNVLYRGVLSRSLDMFPQKSYFMMSSVPGHAPAAAVKRGPNKTRGHGRFCGSSRGAGDYLGKEKMPRYQFWSSLFLR